MTSTTTVCDLCPATTPHETKFNAGFTTINVQGEGPLKLKPLLGRNDNHVDLCKHCLDAFLSWAVQRKEARANAKPHEVAPVPDAVNPPSVPNHIVLTEPPHAEAPPVADEPAPPTEEHHE